MVKKNMKKKTIKSANYYLNKKLNHLCSGEKPKINSFSLAYTLAILSAGCMLVLSVLGKLGYYTSAVEMMKAWHLSYSLSFWGVIGGMAEAALCGLVVGFIGGWLYDKFS